jgi:regulatory protein
MLPKSVKPKRTKSPEQALSALMRLAARSEKSSGDALRLMQSWSVEPSARQGILQKLIDNKFIDDHRYAEAFVRDKINLSGWGAYKIKSALRAKGVSREVIESVVEPMLGETNMSERLEEMMQRKLRTLKYNSPYEAKTKLIRFAASRVYDIEQAIECASKVIND